MLQRRSDNGKLLIGSSGNPFDSAECCCNAEPPENTCNNCDPPHRDRYTVTLSGATGGAAEYNGVYTMNWISGCSWIAGSFPLQDYEFLLTNANVPTWNLSVQLAIPETCQTQWSINGSLCPNPGPKGAYTKYTDNCGGAMDNATIVVS